MLRSYALLLVFLTITIVSKAQAPTSFGFEYRPVAKVVHGTDTLRNAWAGGFNTPQFSTIDLNNDGQQDLFAFDHETNRCYTFLNVATAGTAAGRRWQYAPEYETIFPDSLNSWVLLRDYDCDGRADIFTYVNGGNIAVLRNVLVNGRVTFQLTTNQIRYSGSFVGTANLTIGGYNLPAIQDVNGDGKLDIMSYDFVASSQIEQYINTSPGTCGGALTFTMSTSKWGDMEACSGCSAYMLNGQQCFTAQRPTHTGGHSLLLVDLDGDGDQDVLDGRDNCPELTRLLNQGTTAAPVVTQAGISSSFPSAGAPVRVPVFPAGYSFDANFDGRPDLVVAPNMVNNLADLVSMSHNVQLYANGTASGAPSYTYQAAGFLQNEMIDVSEGAAPTFGDIDGDGLTDMLIGNQGDQVGGTYRASLTYYRNVGTRARPIFKLMNSDYLGLSSQSLQGIKPVLVDLNRDNAIDLAYSVWDRGTNVLYYILNTANSGQAVTLNAANAVDFKRQGPVGAAYPNPTIASGVLTYTRGDMPYFTDVDNDGFVDLLIGTNETREPGMSLRYFRNRGRGALDSAFVLVNNDFGQIRDSKGQRPVNLSPSVADFDGDGRPDLVVTDDEGMLRFFSDYRSQQGSLFSERNDVLYNNVKGQYETNRLGKDLYTHYGLAAADVDGDGAPELFVGTETGGVLSYGTRNRGTVTATHAEAARALALSVYPNPATATATVETATPTRLTVFDLTGRVVLTGATAQRRHALSLTSLTPGVYLVRATGADGVSAVQRLAVQ
ncbi:T9SS type A sorting domain-containing protein [Hymenobacter negativus]|uniref:T9SS type A sorting domain-containing protein n=1 Tax=Hymenobacter negativus TaxID=2795026 RepID=A0ABS3QHA8_9BACT|nr:T9SS type A sorting domain-containing protein [Hymenobacter negativus]MBO2010634.1 T9SS type A sorting domain-containing protein [Hymenobacter negativus]